MAGPWCNRAGLIDHDLFTFTVPGEQFQDVNWLSQLFYFGLFQLGGLALVQVVNALFLAGTMALLIEVCRRRCGSLFWASLVGAGVFVGIWHVLTIRPQTFSFFLFVLLLDILERAESRPGLLLIPPLLLALWTNLHGAFPAGLMLIGCFFLAAMVHHWRAGSVSDRSPVDDPPTALQSSHSFALLSCLAASTLATLVNPYGWGIYLYVGQTSQRATVRHIDEWLPPTWDLWIGKAFFISLVLLLALCLLTWRNKKIVRNLPGVCDGFMLACFLILACTSAHGSLVAAGAGAPMALMLEGLLPQPQTSQDSKPTLAAGVTFAVVVLLAIFSLPGLQRFQPLLTLRIQPRVEEDLDAVHAELAALLPSGRVFSRFEWGEYMSWSYSPEFTVFMDGRIEIFPDDVWRQYEAITCGAGDWDKILGDYKVDALVLDSEYHARHGLLALVEASPHWQKQFSARNALLFVRTGACKSPNHFHLDVAEFTPKGLDLKAQGCVLATLGYPAKLNDTPKALHRRRMRFNPFGVFFGQLTNPGLRVRNPGL